MIRHEENRGKGAALLTGFAALAGKADWAVTLDADGQHDPGDIPGLIRAIPAGTRPIVIGRREGMVGADVPWTSRFGRKFSNFWVRCAGGPSLTDTQSGMRIYPLPEAAGLGVRARRFQFEVEILVRARWAGIPVVEAPVGVSYTPGDEAGIAFPALRRFLPELGDLHPADFPADREGKGNRGAVDDVFPTLPFPLVPDRRRRGGPGGRAAL